MEQRQDPELVETLEKIARKPWMILSAVLAVVSLALIGLMIVSVSGRDERDAAFRQELKGLIEVRTKIEAEKSELAKKNEELQAKLAAAQAPATKSEPAKSDAKAPASAQSSKAPKELPDAARVHSLASEGDIALEKKELDPALKACDQDGKLGLGVCVMPKQAPTSSWLPVLVTWNKEAVATRAEARKLLGCLQSQPAIAHDNESGANEAELVIRGSFTGECL